MPFIPPWGTDQMKITLHITRKRLTVDKCKMDPQLAC